MERVRRISRAAFGFRARWGGERGEAAEETIEREKKMEGMVKPFAPLSPATSRCFLVSLPHKKNQKKKIRGKPIQTGISSGLEAQYGSAKRGRSCIFFKKKK